MAETAHSGTLRRWAGRFAQLFLCGIMFICASEIVAGQASTPDIATKTDRAPDWEVKAGGQMSFEVAAIHGDPAEKSVTPPVFLLSQSDSDLPEGGRFHADAYLPVYIAFAYKLGFTNELRKRLVAQLPEWATSQSFSIDARARENSTKDQVRLMVRSLLAERFHFVMHFEERTVPAFELILDKPGITGRRLHPHMGGPSCFGDDTLPSASVGDPSQAFCHHVSMTWTDQEQQRLEGRDMSMESIGNSIPALGNVSRPVIDETGLKGTYDFTVEWVPERDSNLPQMQETAFLDELKRQLGLKLKPSKTQLRVPIVDHVERPTEN